MNAPAPIAIRTFRRRITPVLRAVLFAALATAAVAYVAKVGMDVRQWTYENTDGLRHRYDVQNNFLYGSRAIDEGWLNVYGNVLNDPDLQRTGRYMLDYVPLRLLVMRQWASKIRADQGPVTEWQPEYAFTRPLLLFMTAMEAAAAIAVFILIRMWIRRSYAADGNNDGGEDLPLARPPMSVWKGSVAGAIGALLVWFSPAAHFSAHAWPSSDIWVPPFFLWTVVLACLNRWFGAGVLLAIGALMKGQQLIVAPLFILWPLFMGKPGAALRFVSGFGVAWGVVVSRWMLRDEATRLTDWAAVAWVMCVGIACVLFAIRRKFVSHRWAGVGLIVAAVLLVVWPFTFWRNHTHAAWLLLFVPAIAAAWWLPLRKHVYLTAAAIGTALMLCPLLFTGDLTWWRLSFVYGGQKFPDLHQTSANTLGALLEARFGWKRLTDVITVWPGGPSMAIKTFLIALYSIGLTFAAAGLARHSIRPDRRFLVAVATPWMVAYAFIPQMHARYMLMPATVAAVLAGVSVGMVLLDLILIALAWMMTVHVIVSTDRQPPGLAAYIGEDYAQPVWRFIDRSQPDAAWVVIFIALIFVYLAVTASRPIDWRKIHWPKRMRWRRRAESPKAISAE